MDDVEVQYMCMGCDCMCIASLHGWWSNKWLERLQKCNTECICSVRVGSRVALRGICGRVRVADMHVVSGEICTVLHAGCDGEVSCMCV
jgi:hypothetical protein